MLLLAVVVPSWAAETDGADIQALLERREAVVRTMVHAAGQFAAEPCGEGTSCIVAIRDYGASIDEIDRNIASLSPLADPWQEGVDGLIDPQREPDGSFAQYRDDPERHALHDRLVAAHDRFAAVRVHRESSVLAKRTRDEAIASLRNFCLDGTLKKKKLTLELIKRLQDAGYEVTVIGALLPVDVGVERVIRRAEITGRYIPIEFVEQAYEAIAAHAEKVARTADEAWLYDTDIEPGEAPRLVAHFVDGKPLTLDEEFLKELRAE